MRKITAMVAVVGLLSAAGCKKPVATAEQVEQAYTAYGEAVEKASTDQQKLDLTKSFLDRHPDTRYTGRVLGAAVELLTEKLKQPEAAEKLVVATRGRVADPKRLRELAIMHVELLAEPGRADDLRRVAAPLAGDMDMAFYDEVGVAEAAVKAQAWDTAEAFAMAASGITGEQLKAMSPGRYPTQQDLDRGVNKRKAWALADLGWAQANLGQVDVALATFQKAGALDAKQLPGNSETSLPVFWARTLLKQGKAAEAVELLAPNALYGGDKEAREVMREAWAAQGGKGDLQAYLDELRIRKAVPAPDFTLADYEGKPHTFSALRNGEVTLLAFWFPT
ncbi:MAG TPA: hypothetical protein PLS53_10610 [Thermoanaerobaculaceae bacterium]|nr:hypothetical protein [Thermoanaerobaculaceae bacterium]